MKEKKATKENEDQVYIKFEKFQSYKHPDGIVSREKNRWEMPSNP